MTSNKPGWVREVSLLLFGMLFLAGIGLTSQIYHLHSEGWQGLLFWLVLMFPVLVLSQSELPNHIWILGLYVTATIWVTRNESMIPDPTMRTMVFVSIPIAITALGLWSQVFRKLFSDYFYAAALVWGLAVVVVFGSVYGNVLWYHSSIKGNEGFIAIPWFFLLLCICGALLRTDVSGRLKKCTSLLLLAIGLYISIPIFWEHDTSTRILNQVIGCGGFILVWALAAASAVFAGFRRLFNGASVIIAVRFIVVYFEVFGSLSTTGIGLIFSGAVILGVAYIWHQCRDRVEAWLREAA